MPSKNLATWRTARLNLNRVPPLANKAYWSAESEPLAVFLSTPRLWPELEAWAKQSRVSGDALRNQLAYLESIQRAYATESRDGIVWVGARAAGKTKR